MDWENRHFVPFSMLMWHVQEDYSGEGSPVNKILSV